MNTRTMLLLVSPALLLVGCATGRGPGGEVILGMEVGQLADTVEQGLIAATGLIPGVGPMLSNILGGLVAGGATVAGAARVVHNRTEASRRKSDIKRETAERNLAVARATNGDSDAA